MKDNSSGITGILGIAVCVGLFLAARKFFPSLATLMLWLAVIAGVVIVILIGLVIYFSVTGNKEKNDPDSPSAVLSKARADLMELRRMQVKIKNRGIANLCRELTDIGEKILAALKQKPNVVSDARQFLNYYLPTLGKILTSYVRVEESGSMTEELQNNTVIHLEEIKKAMEKQYNSLFDDDKLDLTVDMEALTLACKRDGLLDGEEKKGNEE
jgi:hypothetical protein